MRTRRPLVELHDGLGVESNLGPVWYNAHLFTTVDQLLEVPGIGQRRFDQLKDLVTVA